jgi:hypothetical protein
VAQAVEGRLVLLHVNRASLLDPNDLVAQSYHQEELARQTDTAAIRYQQADGLLTTATVEVSTDLALETSAPCPRTRVVRLTPAPLPAGTGLGHFQKRRPWYC